MAEKRGTIVQWPDTCSTEERIFLDLPWDAVHEVVAYARECVGDDSALAVINNALTAGGLEKIADLALPAAHDDEAFRRVLGKAAKNETRPWFKEIGRGERLAEIIGLHLDSVAAKPLAQKLSELRTWIDE